METLDFDKVEFVHDIKQINLLVEYLYNTKNADFDMGMALVYKRGLNFYVIGDNRSSYHKVNRLTLWFYFFSMANKIIIKQLTSLPMIIFKSIFDLSKTIFK